MAFLARQREITNSHQQAMRPLKTFRDFPPTQPLPEHQERLRRQRPEDRPAYVPNHVPVYGRLLVGILGITWVAWAMVGLLSGHMFFQVAKRPPIHFGGIPAILFSLAVLACAAVLKVVIVDHYDRRDNEKTYRKVQRALWQAGAFLLLMAIGVGVLEHLGWLPWSDGSVGLKSTEELKTLLAWDWLRDRLVPYADRIDLWSWLLVGNCIVGILVMGWLGFIKTGEDPRPGPLAFALVFLMAPALASFALSVVTGLLSGSILVHLQPLAEDEQRARIALIHTMLVGSIGAFLCFLLLAAVLTLRIVGVLPESPPMHAQNRV